MEREVLERIYHAINIPGDRLTGPDKRYDNILVDKNGSPTIVECLGTVSFRDSLKLNVYEDGTFRVAQSATATDRKTIADYARGHDFIERLGLNDAS
jgi:hypothetical protein